MRRREFEMSQDTALAFLRRQATVHLAATDDAGRPLLRVVHPIFDGDWLYFHAAPAGEKTLALGRHVVFSSEALVATVPSYFFDAERACPATTYYRSVQAEGVLTELTDAPTKARVLTAMMQQFQPEGGHVPIEAEHPLYRAAVKGLLIAGIPLTHIAGKAKLAQNRTPAQRKVLLEKLWQRGAPGDVGAIELIREANPDTETPAFLEAPEGLRVHCAMPATLVDETVHCLRDAYWNDLFSLEELRAAHLNATAWVGVVDGAGHVVATARALSDGGKYAWVWDVMVVPAYRGRGLGKLLMRLLLGHPAIRNVRRVCLATRDAQGLYAQFGFVERGALPKRPYLSTEMVRERSAAVTVAIPHGHPTQTEVTGVERAREAPAGG